MVSLTMMARLLEALRPTTRLVLVGDPDQLASVEAGAVLGDLVDRTVLGRRTPRSQRRCVPRCLVLLSTEQPASSPDARCATVSPPCRPTGGSPRRAASRGWPPPCRRAAGRTRWRCCGRAAPRSSSSRSPTTRYLTADQLAGVRADVQECGAALHEAAERGDAVAALSALDRHRLLCAHRRGPRGVQHWSALAARWIADEHPVVPRADGRYAGEPLLVTTNDYEIGLYNGDTGVVVDDGAGGLVAAFGRGGAPIIVPLVRLGAVRSLHAMTVHRSQGSQFARITVLLPPAGSPLGTRETLYTAVTRAKEHVRVIGSAEAFVAAVARPAARATGLRDRLQPATKAALTSKSIMQ